MCPCPLFISSHGTLRQVEASYAQLTDVRLLTNNPDKAVGLATYGVRVSERVPIIIEPTEDNLRYLQTKAERMGHDLPHLLTTDPVEDRA